MMSSLMEQVLLITHMLSRVSSMGTLKGRCTYEKADVARQAESLEKLSGVRLSRVLWARKKERKEGRKNTEKPELHSQDLE